jgi:predicted phage terminase large subunit-like protein
MEPEYKATLASLPPEQQRALLYGCWHYTSAANLYFNRNWIEMVDTAPKDIEMCRAWDLASTKPHPENPKPDYTAGVKMAKGRDGFYYILDADQFQMSPGERNREMAKLAKFDSDDCYQVVPLDPGAAGKVAYQELAKIFIEEGIICKADETRGDKIKRFEPFSAAAQSGLVRIVKSTFNPEMLETYLKQLEGFTGARSHGSRKDDLVDATSSAFAFLCKKKVLPSFTLSPTHSPTPISTLKGLS